MKILIIHPFFSSENARGSEIIAQDTYRILKNYGHEVFYFATNKKPYLEEQNWTKYFPDNCHKFTPKFYWNKDAARNLQIMLNEIMPDIIHIHGTNILTYSIFKSIFDRKIPTIMTIHDTGIHCPVRFGWNNVTQSECRKCFEINNLLCIFNNCVQTKKRISSFNIAMINFLEKISGYNKKINKFIAPSKALANYITSKDIPLQKIEIIPNFINNQFMQKISNCYNEQNYFLYVGTLANYKGVDTLLEAVKNLPKEILFKIIGSGFQEEKYKNFVKENKLHNVEFLGNLDRQQIIKYYENSISLIVPSNYFEIFGMINLEAFACSRPVIASKIGGIPEIVEDNINGLLFEPANVEQLKECILKYWNNPNLAIEHGKNGYQKVHEKYTEEKYYNKLIKVYKEVLDEK